MISANPALAVSFTPNEAICIGCYKVTAKMECYTGKINKGVTFAEVKTEELTFNPLTGKVELEEVDKKVPIGKWIRGWICRTCASNYRMVEHVRKDGSKWYEPVVKLDPSATSTTTLNPGDGGDFGGPHEKPDDGFGVSLVLSTEKVDTKSLGALTGYHGPKNLCGTCGKHRDVHGVSGKCPPRKTLARTRTSLKRDRDLLKSSSQLNAEASK